MNDKIIDPSRPHSPFDIGAIPIAEGDLPPTQPEPEAAKEQPATPPLRGDSSPDEQGRSPSLKSGGPRRRAKYALPLRPWPTVLAGIGLLVGYLLLSQLFVSLFLPRLLADYWSKNSGRSVTIARAEWRPLTMVLTLHNGIVGPRLSDPHDRVDPLLSFRTLRVSLRPTALFRSGQLFKELHLEQPFLHLARDEAGNYNLPWLATTSGDRLLPGELTIGNGRLIYTDQGFSLPSQPGARRGVFQEEAREISGGWQLGPKKGRPTTLEISLQAAGPGGAAIGLQGLLALGSADPVAPTDLQLSLQGLPLIAFAAYLHPLLAQEIDGGVLTMRAHFLRDSARELKIDQWLEIGELRLGQQPASPRATGSWQLLQALLTDRNGNLKLHLPLKIESNHQNSPYLRELAAALDQMRQQAASNPQTLLAANHPHLVKQIDFTPGSAELSREAGRGLDLLAAALGDYPLLRVEITGWAGFACDQEALRLREQKLITEQRRQAVTTLAREMAAGGEITVTAQQLAGLRPENVTIGERELLELAAARQQVVRRRLAVALGVENGSAPSPPPSAANRLLTPPPSLRRDPTADDTPCATVKLQFQP
ncbi:DUF748 domain-containing protein [Desulfurivibrio sp. D14AmB]|uniref:DUF748 domain-containing protein n=1 Tax=Desulfurivibrio sp. D14AmB TaxID=3374370 RepID=UPI00376F287E